jgi:hypothetical protein
MPNFIKQRRNALASSLVQPGEGVKFHNERASPILGPASSAIVWELSEVGGVGGTRAPNDEVERQ